ncbi:DUF968 domain-containing protein [Ancylobacter defluvii]|uniref:Uncharacterized protein n=1 Tax=Ancylobacter defluvii TaxID=1282440 RepID=A0A9W6JZ91_9HYPH|nr:DUF968 domain-containing protein [Ancylobacter defluvii]MBS7588245.1 DUF968 domain-containing protein [Ancylobacter defluvii]GLK86641.1 hypothetical protein GCM10017653_47110 [Ancylobacter defluvii]
MSRFAPAGAHPKRAYRGRPKAEGVRDEQHLQLLRQCPCLACGGEPAEAAHLKGSEPRHGKAQGTRHDRWCNPLCPDCHRNGPDCQHAGNERRWWERLGIDPFDVADRLWEASRRLRAQGETSTFIVETMSAIVRAARRRRG